MNDAQVELERNIEISPINFHKHMKMKIVEKLISTV